MKGLQNFTTNSKDKPLIYLAQVSHIKLLYSTSEQYFFTADFGDINQVMATALRNCQMLTPKLKVIKQLEKSYRQHVNLINNCTVRVMNNIYTQC